MLFLRPACTWCSLYFNFAYIRTILLLSLAVCFSVSVYTSIWNIIFLLYELCTVSLKVCVNCLLLFFSSSLVFVVWIVHWWWSFFVRYEFSHLTLLCIVYMRVYFISMKKTRNDRFLLFSWLIVFTVFSCELQYTVISTITSSHIWECVYERLGRR